MSCKTHGTQAKLRIRSSGKIQISTTCMEENHCKVWKEAKILETETNSVYKKYKEGDDVSCVQNPIS
jgi:hypothetical protein